MISAVSVVLLNIVINFTLLGTLQTSIEEIREGTEIMSVLARQRYLISLTVFYFKEMVMYDSGVVFSLDRDTLKINLLNLCDSYNKDIKEIQKYDEGSTPVQKLSEVKTVWYEYYDDHFQLEHKNIINALQRIISLILKFTDLDKVTVDNPYLIEMYRNGYAEVMDRFNKTVINFEKNYEGVMTSFVNLYQIVMLISILLLAILQGLGLAYILYILNKERVKIWDIFSKVPKQVINTTLARLRQKLMDNYNEDLGEISAKRTRYHLPYKHLSEQIKLYILTTNL